MTPTQTIHAFVDEFGDPNLHTDKSGVTEHFIITAVLVTGEQLDAARAGADDVRRQFFGTGEIKSSSVGRGKVQRRLAILNALAEVPHTYYAFAVDKRELHKESGLAFKRTFLKHLSGRLYSRIHRNFSNVHVLADEHGSKEFMKGFESYIHKTVPADLFANRSFGFVRSEVEPLVQVADFISGCLGHALERDYPTDDRNALIAALRKRAGTILEWPPRLVMPEGSDDGGPPAGADADVRAHCLRQATVAYQELSATDTEEARARASTLEFLLYRACFVDQTRYSATEEILEHLERAEGLHLSKLQLRRMVIAPLRDADVVIASSSKGYKIPMCLADVTSFVQHTDKVVIPMLKRVQRARAGLRLTTSGALDILAAAEWTSVRRCIESLQTGLSGELSPRE